MEKIDSSDSIPMGTDECNNRKRTHGELHNSYETITITRNNVTPWVSTKIPILVGVKTLAFNSDMLCEEFVPSSIDIQIMDETSTREFADFLTVVSLFRARLITDWMKSYIMNHMRIIIRVCNENVLSFCKTLVRSAEDILKILEFADNGIYDWISDHQSGMLLLYIQNQKENDNIIENIDPKLFKYILLKASKRFKFIM